MKTLNLDKQTKRNPFTIPEGYFDTLTSRIMEQILEQEQHTAELKPHIAELKPRSVEQKSHSVELKSRSRWVGWSVVAAACIVLAVFFIQNPGTPSETSISPQAMAMLDADDLTYDDQYEEDVLEYAMVDNSDIYNYLAGGF